MCPDRFLQNEWFLFALQIHWNLTWFGSFKEIVNLGQKCASNGQLCFNKKLQLSRANILVAQSTSLDFQLEHSLENIRNAVDHREVAIEIRKLQGYVN